ncbi:MAG: pyrroline-5-carboxylate reductase [Pseudomonadales bacterium]|nr:pyrroline-5-carboxylate reductase [Pseudomonadales bacterium]MCP5183421.1 pyrroline-5-carboxylate reductase [Pseudomonadales bacterium]
MTLQPLEGKRIACIGAGNMAFSLLSGLHRAGIAGIELRVTDVVSSQLGKFAALSARTGTDNRAATDDADIIVLAVKPQVLPAILAALPLAPHQLLISIAAGIPLRTLAAGSAVNQPIVRCMPNTPALVGAGITALFANAHVTGVMREQAEAFLRSVGRAVWVQSEADLDAVTAVSGSGPAYFFYLMEAMVRAGVELGLPPDLALELTRETAYGAALLARNSEHDPATLRANVTSPGGTTERAISLMNEARCADGIVRALHGAAQRSAELAKDS